MRRTRIEVIDAAPWPSDNYFVSSQEGRGSLQAPSPLSRKPGITITPRFYTALHRRFGNYRRIVQRSRMPLRGLEGHEVPTVNHPRIWCRISYSTSCLPIRVLESHPQPGNVKPQLEGNMERMAKADRSNQGSL